ncbi:MAG TPA: aminopeptidase P family N-terminal domain-containing protein [Stellaceae bacterium]|nr:aminopeptidase P family N-terminal domain-containing protein [Stellaceae bacterium]
MRRGLIARSKAELPDAIFAGRVERTRAAMTKAGLGALVVYSNNTRAAGASWLTGFVPYWSEGVMVLTRAGDPALVVALSKRVQTWIEATSRVASVVSTPRIGAETAKLIAASGGGAVGVADLDGFPAGIADDMRAAGCALADATDMFAALRGPADPAELALAAHAAAIAHDALACILPEHGDANAVIAAVEGRARAHAAEECYVALAPDLARERRFKRIEGQASLGRSHAIRATVAYKGAWVRLARTVFRDHDKAHIAPAAAEVFAACVAGLPQASGFGGASAWLVEGCRVAQPLEALMGSRVDAPRRPAPGALVSVTTCIEHEGEPVMLAAPALLGASGEPAALLVPPVFREGD